MTGTGLCKYLRRCARRKSLCVDDCTGQEHFERGNLHRSQCSQQAEQHFIQEQEKGAEAAGRMVSCGKYPRSHHFRRSVPKSSRADCKQTQETQKRYDTDFRRIDKMCRLRMVFSLWGKQAEQKPIRVLPLQQKRTGITPVFHALYPL